MRENRSSDRKGLLSVKGRRQALPFCLDFAVVLIRRRIHWLLPEVSRRLQFLQIEQLAFVPNTQGPIDTAQRKHLRLRGTASSKKIPAFSGANQRFSVEIGVPKRLDCDTIELWKKKDTGGTVRRIFQPGLQGIGPRLRQGSALWKIQRKRQPSGRFGKLSFFMPWRDTDGGSGACAGI